ncbi:MAG TPA: hypothetical protein P5186_10195 [Candidatus Paceibacterota bacterium]|nr:hypothetical protein [Verrucomicrobiota bacterium]HRY48407.1 hypothetical protein [Candidatus Paceibacterota bacterium]HSA01003.1 hypothetical protein [Candidatus Paceibacterota bacterium]
MLRKIFLMGMLIGLTAGCRTTMTNLTPSQVARNNTGLYPFEVIWDTTQQSIREETLKASVVLGEEVYPMQRTPKLNNRWEAFIPVPADKSVISYRYRFDYEYLSIPNRRQNSRLTPQYQLQILNK